MCSLGEKFAPDAVKAKNALFSTLGKEYLKNYRKWMARFGFINFFRRAGSFGTIRVPIGR